MPLDLEEENVRCLRDLAGDLPRLQLPDDFANRKCHPELVDELDDRIWSSA